MQTNLEKELKAWRESRSRAHETTAEERAKVFASHGNEHRRVKVNGQEVLVVSRAKRPVG